jgi:hypothetical protein
LICLLSSVWMLRGCEQLPIGSQTVFSGTVRKNGTVLKQARSAEDHGVSAEINTTLMKHLIVAAIYNHSVRFDDSTEGVSLTFLMHIPPAMASGEEMCDELAVEPR